MKYGVSIPHGSEKILDILRHVFIRYLKAESSFGRFASEVLSIELPIRSPQSEWTTIP